MDDNEPLPEFWPVPTNPPEIEKDNTESHPTKFWKQFFGVDENKRYKWIDIIFGMILPILGLILDPGLFRNGLRLLSSYQVFVYTGVKISIFALAIWLFFFQKNPKLSGLFASIFILASFFAMGIQIIILPFALNLIYDGLSTFFSDPSLGIWFIELGICGLLPLLTVFVYLRNGIFAYFNGTTHVLKSAFVLSLLLGVALLLLPSGFTQWQFTTVCTQNTKIILDVKPLQSTDKVTIRYAIKNLKSNQNMCNQAIDEIVWAYSDEGDPNRKLFLADTYFEVTEEDIEHRLTLLED